MDRSTSVAWFQCWRLAGQALLCLLPALPMAQAGATTYAFTTSGTWADGGAAATDINRSGTAVGYQFDNATAVSTAFVSAGGVKTYLAGPAGSTSVDLFGISDSGLMVGNYANTLEDDGTGNLFPGPTRMFSLFNGVYTDLAIPGLTSPYLRAISGNGRWLVGYTIDGLGAAHGFAFDGQPGGALTLFDGTATSVIAAGVNNLGVVVGYDRTFVPGVGQVGPGWTVDLLSGQRTEFQVAGSQRSGPRDITDGGVISGYYFTSPGPAVAHGFTGLGGNFEFFDVPGASQTFVSAGNDLGALAGFYLDADGNQGAFVAVPVPEPAAAWLLLAGLSGLAVHRRRNARSVQS